MTDEPQDRRLFREAADLAIRLQSDPANPVSVETVRLWAARSPQHAAVWARVAEIHGMAGKILADERKTGRKAEGSTRITRRTLLVAGAAGLGAAGVGSLTVPHAILLARADHATSTAEIRRVGLPDGSVMTLGPDSAAAIGFTTAQRRIELLAGMAYFEVAAEAARPFAVSSGPVTATALGTAFDVSNDAGFVSVSVERGAVEARAPVSLSGEGRLLGPGEWIILDPSSHEVTHGTREAFQIAAWRGGMIVADRETVAAMVAKIARWLPGRVVVADPYLGARRVSGVFDIGDPLRALEAVARPFGARVRAFGPLMTVISPI